MNEPACRVCGCTDDDCTQCYLETGMPCHWVEADLCSRCALKPVKMSGDTGEQPWPLTDRPKAVLA